MADARQLTGFVERSAAYFASQRAVNDPTSALRGALLKVEVTNRAAITDEQQLGALMVSIDEYDGCTPVEECVARLRRLSRGCLTEISQTSLRGPRIDSS